MVAHSFAHGLEAIGQKTNNKKAKFDKVCEHCLYQRFTKNEEIEEIKRILKEGENCRLFVSLGKKKQKFAERIQRPIISP